jgi:hypothetical protein
MTPLAEAQQLATLWMESYFDRFVLFCSCTLYVTHSTIFYPRFGDHAPDKDLTKISVVEKQEIFTLYVRDLGEKAALIDIKRFYEIWNVVFPKIVQKTSCDICGKCWLCYEVDCLRHSSEDSAVQEYAKKAHHLHRGGLFMLERNEYVLLYEPKFI